MKISPISTTKNIRENILQDNSRTRIIRFNDIFKTDFALERVSANE
jgi:hypothetical protein